MAIAQIALRLRVALLRGLAVPMHGPGQVGRHAVAEFIAIAEIELSPCEILVGRLAVPVCRLDHVLLHSESVLIAGSQVALRPGMSLQGSLAIPVCGLGRILLHSVSVLIANSQFRLRPGISLLGRFTVPVYGPSRILLHSLPMLVTDAQVFLRPHIPLLRRLAIPVCGHLIVFRPSVAMIVAVSEIVLPGGVGRSVASLSSVSRSDSGAVGHHSAPVWLILPLSGILRFVKLQEIYDYVIIIISRGACRADGTCRSRDRCSRSNRSRRGGDSWENRTCGRAGVARRRNSSRRCGIHCSEQFLNLVAQCGELPGGIGEGVNAKVLHVPSLWGREVFVGDAENENGFPVFGSEFHLDAGLFGSVEVRGVDDHHHAAHAHGVDNGSGAAFAGRYVPACHEAAYAAFLQICTNIFRHLAVMAGTRYENIVFHRLQYQKSFQS